MTTPLPTASTRNSRSPRKKPHVAVVGGGTAGLHAVIALCDASDAAVTIVEPTGHHQFLTRLAGVAGGAQPVGDAARPLAEMAPFATTISRRVTRVEERKKDVVVHLENGETFQADAAVVTAGAEPARPPIKGLRRARPLRSAADALAIRSALEDADALVVIGAGATGSQLAATAAVEHPDLRVALVDGNDRVMPGFREALGRRAGQILANRHVDLRLGQRVDTVGATHVVLADSGEHLDGVVVWAGGFEAAGDTLGLGATRNGRLVVDSTGRTSGSSRVFAAGDIAAHTDRRSRLRPMSAQIAAQAGRGVGSNVAAFLAGRRTRPLTLTDLGWVVDLGGGRGVADVLGIPLADRITDRLVPALHTAIDYRNLWQLGGVSFMRSFGPGATSTPTPTELARDLAAFDLDLD